MNIFLHCITHNLLKNINLDTEVLNCKDLDDGHKLLIDYDKSTKMTLITASIIEQIANIKTATIVCTPSLDTIILPGGFKIVVDKDHHTITSYIYRENCMETKPYVSFLKNLCFHVDKLELQSIKASISSLNALTNFEYAVDLSKFVDNKNGKIHSKILNEYNLVYVNIKTYIGDPGSIRIVF